MNSLLNLVDSLHTVCIRLWFMEAQSLNAVLYLVSLLSDFIPLSPMAIYCSSFVWPGPVIVPSLFVLVLLICSWRNWVCWSNLPLSISELITSTIMLCDGLPCCHTFALLLVSGIGTIASVISIKQLWTINLNVCFAAMNVALSRVYFCLAYNSEKYKIKH